MSARKSPRDASREPFHYRHRAFFVGLFILVPFLLVPLFLVYSLIRSDVLEKWRVLYVRYESAEGLQKGSAVTIRGISVGHVESVVLNEQGDVDVRLKIRRRFGPFLKKNSVARLRQKNFVVGDWEIEITGGGQYSEPAHDGDTLNGELPLQLEQTVQQVTNMVASLEILLQSVMAGEGLLGRLLGDDTLMDVAEEFAGRLDRLFSRVEDLVGDANGMISELAAFGSHGTATVDTLMTFAHHADSMVASLDEVARDIDDLVEKMGEVPSGIDDVLRGLKRDVREAETLLRGLQNHWLFRRSVRKAREEGSGGE